MVGWVCYLLAIAQYLIIGLVTSRDRAMDVLSEFDRAVAERRRELIDEFEIDVGASAAPDSNGEAESSQPESAPTPSDVESGSGDENPEQAEPAQG